MQLAVAKSCSKPHLCLIKTLAGDANNLLQNVTDVFTTAMIDKAETISRVVAKIGRRCQNAAHIVVVDYCMATIYRRFLHFIG